MSTVQEIELAIGKLPTKDKWDLHKWLAEQMADEWDRQIEADVASGKLDSLAEAARQEIREGKTVSLDEFLGNS
jgi:hypothetical protein